MSRHYPYQTSSAKAKRPESNCSPAVKIRDRSHYQFARQPVIEMLISIKP